MTLISSRVSFVIPACPESSFPLFFMPSDSRRALLAGMTAFFNRQVVIEVANRKIKGDLCPQPAPIILLFSTLPYKIN
jgi:hypothetical protein